VGEYRVTLEAGFTVTKKKNAESTREAVIKMIKESGFEEKDFIISIDKSGLIEGLNKPEIIKNKNKPEKKEKKIINIKRKGTRVRKKKK